MIPWRQLRSSNAILFSFPQPFRKPSRTDVSCFQRGPLACLQEVWSRKSFLRATCDVGVPGELAAASWMECVKAGNPDATTDMVLDLGLTWTIRRSRRLSKRDTTFAEEARATKLSCSREVVWLAGDPPVADHLLQVESLQQAMHNVSSKLPIESDTLLPLGMSTEQAAAIKDCASEEELEQQHEQLKGQFVLMGQLCQSMRQAAAEINAQVKKRKAQAMKADEKRKSNQLKEQGEKAERERLKLQKKSQMDPFQLEFGQAGFGSVTHANKEPATSVLESQLEAFAPLKLKEWECIGALQEKGSEFDKVMLKWVQSFPDAKQCKASGRVIAPVPGNMQNTKGGNAAADKLSSLILSHGIKNDYPRFATATSTWFLYGESDTSIYTDFEHELLGSLRVQLHGTTQFYGMPVSCVLAGLDGLKIEKKRNASAADIKSFLAEMSQKRLEGIRDMKLSFAHGTLEPGHGLIVPPGWVMSYASVGDEQHVAGIRCSFLPRFGLENIIAQYEHMLAKELADKQWLNFLLTLLRVELKGNPPKRGADGNGGAVPAKKLKLKTT